MELLQNSISIIASFISLSLFIYYPLPTLDKIHKRIITDVAPPYPFLAFMFNNFIWFLYSIALLQSKNGVPIFYIRCLNYSTIFAFFFETLYLFDFGYYSTRLKIKVPAIVISFLWYFVAIIFAFEQIPMYTKYLGPIAIASGIVMYASPTIQIAKCREEESLEELPVVVCAGLFMQSVTWFGAAVVITKVDIYLAVTSGIGMVLVLIELGLVYKLYMKYSEFSRTVHPVVEVVQVQH